MRKSRKKHLGTKILLGCLLIGIVSVLVGVMTITWMTYHASESAKESWLAPSVQHQEGWTYFPTNGEVKGTVVFYGGALVESDAYAKLAEGLSHNGIATYIIHSTLNFPILSKGTAVKIADSQSLSKVYVAGHSLGGVVAAMDAKNLESEGKLSGVIFLASYPSSDTDLSQSQARVLSITGTEDRIMKQDVYEAAKGNLPESTLYVSIQGGNHSGFGLYGHQRGDGETSVSAALQQEEVVKMMTAFITSDSKK